MQVKAAVTLGNQQPFVIKDIEVARPGKDEILVKIAATGVCHTDAFTLSVDAAFVAKPFWVVYV